MAELVQTFRFRVRLTRAAPGSTLTAPPKLGFPTSKRDLRTEATEPPGRRPPPKPPFLAAATTGATGPGGSDQLGDGAFQECSGLDLEADVKEYLEGGRNDGVIRRAGRAKLQPMILKRGMFVVSTRGYADTALWDWLTGMVTLQRPLPRYDGHVDVLDAAGRRIVAQWSFDRGLPVKVTGPALNAKTGDIAIEELHIAHEGLRLERKVR